MAPNSPTAIMVDSGRYFDVQAPRWEDVDLDDIAHSAGQTVRFNGHTTRPITTAEHMCRVGRLAAAVADPGFEEEARFYGHIHDAHESYTPWGDCLRPGKTGYMREIEERIDAAIFRALAGEDWQPSEQARRAVKAADSLALYFEATLWMKNGADWAATVLPECMVFDPARLAKLLPQALPDPGDTLTHAIMDNKWVGERWLRTLWGAWPKAWRNQGLTRTSAKVESRRLGLPLWWMPWAATINECPPSS